MQQYRISDPVKGLPSPDLLYAQKQEYCLVDTRSLKKNNKNKQFKKPFSETSVHNPSGEDGLRKSGTSLRTGQCSWHQLQPKPPPRLCSGPHGNYSQTHQPDLSQGHKAIFHQGKEQKFSKLKTVNFFQPLSQRKTPEDCDSEAPYFARLECSTLRFQAPHGKDSAPV